MNQITLTTLYQHNNQNQSKNILQEDSITPLPLKDLRANYPPHTPSYPPSSKPLLKENKSQPTSHPLHLPAKSSSLQHLWLNQFMQMFKSFNLNPLYNNRRSSNKDNSKLQHK